MLYEVLAPGYHSPLTKTQISELFRAGRLGRSHRCKQVSQKEWRTVDELFPLLKYQSATISCDEPWQPVRHSAIDRSVVLGCAAAALAVAALLYYFGSAARSAPERYRPLVTETRWPRTISTRSTSDPFTTAAPETNQPPVNAVTTYALSSSAETARVQLAAQQRQAQDRERRQAELTRLQQEQAKHEEKARGQDVIIPLDEYSAVNIGGVGVSVKIHDNDVTSFDVWINGRWFREVPKQKGITQSGTDETLIYNSGRARLYYVWEISGTLNCCRLRVREN